MEDPPEQPAVPETPVGPRTLEFRFVGTGSEYFRIWIVNLVLTIFTVGLYYPFAKVRKLTYFHANTEIGGYPLSFHGDPKRMLRGYLIVGLSMGLYTLLSRISPIATIAALVVLTLAWPTLWHAALRFRLGNTGWLGLRGRFLGTRAGAYATLLPASFPSFLFVVAATLQGPAAGDHPQVPGPLYWITLLALVVATPWMLWVAKRYQHNHFAFAGERSEFSLKLGSVFGLGLRGFGVSMIASFLCVALLIAVVMLAGAQGSGAKGPQGFAATALSMAAFVVAFQIVMYPWFVARMQNAVWNHTQSQHFKTFSRLRARSLAWLNLKNWVLIVLTLGFYFPFAAIRTLKLRVEAMSLETRIDPEQLVSTETPGEIDAAGDAASDLMGFDVGL